MHRPPSKLRRLVVALCSIGLTTLPSRALPQLPFNFGSAGSVQPSIANQSCGGATGGMGGMGGTCDGSFMQEVTTIGGSTYYHVVIGTQNADFGIEYYIRTVSGTVCWYGCTGARISSGMGGMGGGGVAPLSASAGAGGLSGNNINPLGSSNNGNGRPDQTAIYQYNKSSEMTQAFLKATETGKPKITQTLATADTSINFSIDMSTIGYNTSSTAGVVALSQTVTSANMPGQQQNPGGGILPSSSNFNIATVGATAQSIITGGRYTYSPGGGDGGSMGSYTYFADSFNPYNVNWASFCDPAQNPISNCTNYGGGAGMGGGSTSGGMVSSSTASTASATTTTVASGGGMGGGM